jgi:hypothetical protein
MSTSGTELRQALAQGVSVGDDALVVDLVDGRTIAVPLAWFPRLAHGTASERANWCLIGGGEGIHWPDLDEDISVEGLQPGRKSGETQESVSTPVAPNGGNRLADDVLAGLKKGRRLRMSRWPSVLPLSESPPRIAI